jgi:DNA-binding MarR family transcriptional regulator
MRRTSDDRPEQSRELELIDTAVAVRRGVTALAARARSERRGTLTINAVAVLGLLAKAGVITPGEVANRLQAQPQSLTRTFAALERDGLTLRMSDPADGRQSLLALTEAGRSALRAEMRPRDEWLAGVLRTVTAAELAALAAAAPILERLALIDVTPARREP